MAPQMTTLGPDIGDAAGFVMELADWMVDNQVRADGSYLIDLGARGPSALTGFAAEGVGRRGGRPRRSATGTAPRGTASPGGPP